MRPTFDTENQVDEECNDILEEAFKKIDKKVQDKKKVHFSQEEDDFKTEALYIGSYGSSMFHNWFNSFDIHAFTIMGKDTVPLLNFYLSLLNDPEYLQ